MNVPATATTDRMHCLEVRGGNFLYRAQSDHWALASGAAQVERVNGIADTPLGALDEAEYSRFEIKLEPGDMVMCVSDAFTESFSMDGQMLGMDGLLGLIQKLDVSHPETLVQQLTERITHEEGDNLKKDDATVLLFRADGSSPSLTSDLLTPIRFLRGVRDSVDFERKHPACSL